MSKRKEFIKWVSINKLKYTTPVELANVIEHAFSACLNIDVWEISDYKIFSELKNTIILDKSFQKKNKKTYKVFLHNSKYFQTFLKLEYISKSVNGDEMDTYITTESGVFENDLLSQTEENTNQNQNQEYPIREKIEAFFSDKTSSSLFYDIFAFASSKESKLELDIRTAIIGAKVDGERLRFYSDKVGVLKFSKLSKIYKLTDSSFDIEEVYQSIIDVNEYFMQNSDDIRLVPVDNDFIGYVYHIKFGFGVIISKSSNGKILSINFDGDKKIKTLQSNHHSYEEISKADYLNKIKPGSNGTKEIVSRIPWDKYETALLIEAFWKIEKNKKDKIVILTELSQNLRKRAVNMGKHIDDIFRNLNGMSIQLNNVALSFYPERSAMHRTAMFDAIAKIYMNNRNEFNEILTDAYKQIGDIQRVQETSDKTFSLSMDEVDFYAYIKETYAENYKDEGKDNRATKHAQKCIILTRKINEILAKSNYEIKSIYVIKSKDKLLLLSRYIKTKISNIDEKEIKWIKYIFSKYATFILSDFQEQIEPSNHFDQQVFYLKQNNSYVDARMVIENGKYKVLAGSKYSIKTWLSFTNSEKGLRNELERSGVISNGVFLKDCYFNSASTAGKHITGNSVNGNVVWKLANGTLLGEVVKGQTIISTPETKAQRQEVLIPVKKDYPDYTKVIKEHFFDGFAYSNALRKRKFVRCYEEANGVTFTDNDEQYKLKLRSVGFESEEKIYLTDIISEETKKELQNYIICNLSSNAVYYSVLYEVFRDKLGADFTEDMLKKFLQFEFANQYSFTDEYVALLGKNFNLKQELINVFLNAGQPLYIEEIYSKLSNLAKSVIDSTLTDRDFVVNFRGKSYFYKDTFVIEDEQLDEIRMFIASSIEKNTQTSGSELYSFIKNSLPDLIELNPEVTDLGFKNVLKLLLNGEFSFRGDVISSLNNEVSVKQLYKDFCLAREKFTLEELEEFRDSIHKTYIDFNAVFDVAIRINQNTYVRRDLVQFDTNKIDVAISNYCTQMYVSYIDIINFTEFPTMIYPWNNYLLESYLYSSSKKFCILCFGINKEKPVGAIVNKLHSFDDFEDLILDVIKKNKLYNKEKAFEYLQENEYILTRKFKNIDMLIQKAKN